VAAAAFALASAGCMIPSYQLPGGYSSSYQRQIYGMDPVPIDSRTLGLAAVETKPGIFYPTPSFGESSPPTQLARSNAKEVTPMSLEQPPAKPSPPLPTIVMAQ
jgi:hypothetical protein